MTGFSYAAATGTTYEELFLEYHHHP